MLTFQVYKLPFDSFNSSFESCCFTTWSCIHLCNLRLFLSNQSLKRDSAQQLTSFGTWKFWSINKMRLIHCANNVYIRQMYTRKAKQRIHGKQKQCKHGNKCSYSRYWYVYRWERKTFSADVPAWTSMLQLPIFQKGRNAKYLFHIINWKDAEKKI